ncbi:hypothetical protein HNO88_003966 [Novosphingobium chloroacetimidivorans]|uniref:DUF2505 domain-containing protein n=1 Tax=Novosphingobium chloroacetimidivorans TaxID=1428314 RepID=A0A7W7KD36_9SPHN|nr:hypothetical protein [Novosphingobium chloroacetimidivorans]MBB4860622.1 hypothetical protein [Novosphingobium chloroacetimidivorans]
MKPFAALVVLRIAPDLLCTRMRERLSEIGEGLDDIERIEELERHTQSDGIHLVNRWYARQRVPAMLRDRLGADEISWIDRAVWSHDGTGCDWSIEPSFGSGGIRCAGSTRFEEAMGGRGARVSFAGQLDIEPSFMVAIAGPFQGPVRMLAETIATTLIPKNLRTAAEVAASLPALAQEGSVVKAKPGIG